MYKQIELPFQRIDLTEPCNMICNKCGRTMCRGDSVVIGGFDEQYCMHCGNDKIIKSEENRS